MKKRINDAGRPRASKEVIEFIKQIANDNPMWGVPHIHGELLKLGYDISQSIVQRYMSKRIGRTPGVHSQNLIRTNK